MNENITELQRALTQPTRIELAVREADYWSSRQDMSYLPNTSPLDGPHDIIELKQIAEKYNLDIKDGYLITKK